VGLGGSSFQGVQKKKERRRKWTCPLLFPTKRKSLKEVKGERGKGARCEGRRKGKKGGLGW